MCSWPHRGMSSQFFQRTKSYSGTANVNTHYGRHRKRVLQERRVVLLILQSRTRFVNMCVFSRPWQFEIFRGLRTCRNQHLHVRICACRGIAVSDTYIEITLPYVEIKSVTNIIFHTSKIYDYHMYLQFDCSLTRFT